MEAGQITSPSLKEREIVEECSASEAMAPEMKAILFQRLEEQGLWGQQAFQNQMSSQDQIRLKRLLCQDQTGAFAELMERYGCYFAKIAYYTIYNYDLAEDAVSIAWGRFYRWLKRHPPEALEPIDLFPYLCQIVIYAARDLRNQERQQRAKITEKGKVFQDEERWAFASPEDTLVRQERETIVQETIAQLPEPYAQAVRLRLFSDEAARELEPTSSGVLRYKHLADATGYKESTLRSHYHRALQRLRSLLEARGIYN